MISCRTSAFALAASALLACGQPTDNQRTDNPSAEIEENGADAMAPVDLDATLTDAEAAELEAELEANEATTSSWDDQMAGDPEFQSFSTATSNTLRLYIRMNPGTRDVRILFRDDANGCVDLVDERSNRAINRNGSYCNTPKRRGYARLNATLNDFTRLRLGRQVKVCRADDYTQCSPAVFPRDARRVSVSAKASKTEITVRVYANFPDCFSVHNPTGQRTTKRLKTICVEANRSATRTFERFTETERRRAAAPAGLAQAGIIADLNEAIDFAAQYKVRGQRSSFESRTFTFNTGAHNPLMPADINGSGSVSALDTLNSSNFNAIYSECEQLHKWGNRRIARRCTLAADGSTRYWVKLNFDYDANFDGKINVNDTLFITTQLTSN